MDQATRTGEEEEVQQEAATKGSQTVAVQAETELEGVVSCDRRATNDYTSDDDERECISTAHFGLEADPDRGEQSKSRGILFGGDSPCFE